MLSPASASLDTIDPLILWLIVIVADALFAGLPGLRTALAVPLRFVDRATSWLDRKLNREQRSIASRLYRGALLVCVLALAAYGAGWVVAGAARALPYSWPLEAVAIACLILQRRIIDPVRRIAGCLAGHDLDAARAALSRIVAYDSAGLDEHAVARGAVEAGAENLCDGVVAAAFWYLLLGLPGLCVWRTVNVIAHRIGHPSPRFAAFGLTAARLDEVLGLLPALITGMVLVIAAVFVPSAGPARACRVWLRTLRRGGVLDSSRAHGAVAGALGLTLAGPRRLDGRVIGAKWVGDGRARVSAPDVVRAVILFTVVCMIAAAFLAAMVVARGLG